MTIYRNVTIAAALALGLFGAEARTQDPAPLTKPEARKYLKSLALTDAPANTLKNVSVRRDLTYATYGDTSLMLDLYTPTDAVEDLPCVIVITGGGFKPQDKSKFAHVAAYLAANGYAAACISYRGAPDDHFSATVSDAKGAVRYLRANAAKFHLDPDRFGATGQSAGGHLVALLATTGDVSALEGDAGHKDVSSRIQAAVSFAGVYDFIARLRDGGQQQGKTLVSKRESNGAWIGEPFSETSDAWRDAGPIHYVTSDDAPLLMIHCTGDTTVPYQQGELMQAALRKHQAPGELLIIENGSHSVVQNSSVNGQAWKAALAFFDKTLRPASPSK